MRKVIVHNIISIDGFYAGPGDNVMVLPMDEWFNEYNAERMAAADTLLVGRRSYELFKGFWPPVADDPNVSPAHRQIARFWKTLEAVVVSDSLTPDDTEPLRDTTRIVRRAEAHERIADLKRSAGREILMFGSHILWNDLLAAGLVDELHFTIGSVVLGSGTPAFTEPTAGPLRLLGSERRNGSDNVIVRYAPPSR